nr:MAG TPA: hypothetical protein [Caudoviricetes sp.]
MANPLVVERSYSKIGFAANYPLFHPLRLLLYSKYEYVRL